MIYRIRKTITRCDDIIKKFNVAFIEQHKDKEKLPVVKCVEKFINISNIETFKKIYLFSLPPCFFKPILREYYLYVHSTDWEWVIWFLCISIKKNDAKRLFNLGFLYYIE